MTAQTMSEWITANPTNKLYNISYVVDDSLKTLINSYFQFRYVGNSERFQTYFNRELERYFKQYNEMLRIQFTECDWFVNSYMEKMTQLKLNETILRNMFVASDAVAQEV